MNLQRLTDVAEAGVGRLAIKEASGAGLQREAATGLGGNVRVIPIAEPTMRPSAVVKRVGNSADVAVNP